MSRIGKKPITIPQGVKVVITGNNIKVTGTKGELDFTLQPGVSVKESEGHLVIESASDTKKARPMFGMTRAIINNMVKGTSEGFQKKLELVGVGFRAKMNGPKTLSLTVGYSHPVEFEVPQQITVQIDENQAIVVSGADRYLVGQVAANIRKIRKPEPYKGKGIRYADEHVRKKQGKSGKV